jgi:hypothetical protein
MEINTYETNVIKLEDERIKKYTNITSNDDEFNHTQLYETIKLYGVSDKLYIDKVNNNILYLKVSMKIYKKCFKLMNKEEIDSIINKYYSGVTEDIMKCHSSDIYYFYALVSSLKGFNSVVPDDLIIIHSDGTIYLGVELEKGLTVSHLITELYEFAFGEMLQFNPFITIPLDKQIINDKKFYTYLQKELKQYVSVKHNDLVLKFNDTELNIITRKGYSSIVDKFNIRWEFLHEINKVVEDYTFDKVLDLFWV